MTSRHRNAPLIIAAILVAVLAGYAVGTFVNVRTVAMFVPQTDNGQYCYCRADVSIAADAILSQWATTQFWEQLP